MYWDLKALYLTTGFDTTWGLLRSIAMDLEKTAKVEFTAPSAKKHFTYDLTRHVDGLLNEARKVVLDAVGAASGGISAKRVGEKRPRE